MPEEPQEQIGIKTPFFSGFVKGTSTQILIALLAIVLAGAIAFLVYQHDARASVYAERTIAAVKANTASSEEMFKAVIYVNWVCLKSKEECAKLNLAKPKVLRDMER